MNRFSCPHCGKHLTYQITQFGMRIKCPKCQQSLTVGMTSAASDAAKSTSVFRSWWIAAACVASAAVLVILWSVFS